MSQNLTALRSGAVEGRNMVNLFLSSIVKQYLLGGKFHLTGNELTKIDEKKGKRYKWQRKNNLKSAVL